MPLLKPKEKDVLSACKSLLQIYKGMGLLDYHRISTTGIPKAGGGFRPNPAAGFPDLLIWIYDGPDLYVELKAKNGKASESQIEFKRRAEEAGRFYFIVRSSTDLSIILGKILGKKDPIP